MRSLLKFIVGAGALVCGCSTTSLNQVPNILQRFPNMDEILPGKDLTSVDNYLENRLRKEPSEAMEWWTRYQQGKLWSKTRPDIACDRYVQLSTAENFPLKNIARLRALEVCAKDRQDLPKLDDVLTSTTDPWLSDLTKRTILTRAALVGERELELKLSVEVAKLARLQSEKVDLLARAVDLSRELKNPEQTIELSAQLEKIAPRFKPEPQPKEWIDVAFDYRKARDFNKSRDFYAKILQEKTLTDVDRYRALDGIRLARKLEVRDDRYVAATQELAEFARMQYLRTPRNRFWVEKFHDSHTLLARTMWTERSVDEALKVLQKLERELKNRHPLDEIRWLRARIEEEAGRYESALKILDDAQRGPNRNREMNEKIYWYRAWNLRKMGRHQDAVAAFRRLNQKFGSTTNGPRNRFWMAKSLKSLGHTIEASEEFKTLIAQDPLGYYALLSYRELNVEMPPVQPTERMPTSIVVQNAAASTPVTVQIATRDPANSSEAELAAFPEARDRAYIEWLLAVGENKIARQYLNHDNLNRRPSKTDQLTEKGLLKYHARAGNYQTLFAHLQNLPAEMRQRMIDDDPSLLFPQPYSAYVADASKRFGIAPEFVYAIMRQESSFDPQARSHADAFGLMQLIPEAARKMSETTGISLQTPEELYQPDISITTGTAFIRHLMTGWNDQFILTVASYNASEKAIEGWLKTRWHGDALEFIEDIPYEETRTYVKLVMRNYAHYLRLNSRGMPVPFPEWCLEIRQDHSS